MRSKQAGSGESSQRRRVVRVRTDLNVVIALHNGDKRAARVLDLGTGGMLLTCDSTPSYGEAITVIVRLREAADWSLIPAKVRWFSRQGFGVAFEDLDDDQERDLAAFVDQSAA